MAANFTISAIIKAVDKITAPVAAITSKVSALTAPLKRVGMGLKAFSDNTGITKLGRGIGWVVKQVFALTAALASLAGIGIAGVFAWMTRGFIDAGDEAATTASKLKVTTQELQRMRYAASMLDVEQETLDGGLKKLSRSITMASKGAKDQVKAFKLLGYTDKEIRAGKISVTDATVRLAKRMEDEKKAKSNAIAANALYGKSYLEMMPMLSAGGDKIRELAAEAERLGLVMTDEMIQNAADADDAFKRLGFSITGVRNEIGSKLVPYLTPLIDSLWKWIAANRELIGQKLTEFINAVSQAVKGTDWEAVGNAVTAIGKAFYYMGAGIYYVIEGFKVIGGWIDDFCKRIDTATAKIIALGNQVRNSLPSMSWDGIKNMFGGAGVPAAAPPAPTGGFTGGALAGAAINNSKADVTVKFQNPPPGTRVDSDVKGRGLNLGVDVGHQAGGAF